MTSDEKIVELSAALEKIVQEVAVPHAARLRYPVKAHATLATLLDAARTICRPINEEIDASLCLECDHFIGCNRQSDGSLVIHCWTHQMRVTKPSRLARGTMSFQKKRNQ